MTASLALILTPGCQDGGGVQTTGTSGASGTSGETGAVTDAPTSTTTSASSSTEPTMGASGSAGTTVIDTSGSETSEVGTTDTTATASDDTTGASPTCGNGVLDADEACDDGNLISSDGCEADCVATHIERIVVGGYNTCAIFASGRMRCWGENGGGQLGLGHIDSVGDNELPAEIADIDLGDDRVESAAIDQHTCAVLVGGGLRCWGTNTFGELGYGHTESIGDDELLDGAGLVAVGGPVAQVTVGENATCALLTSGAVRCWGRNYEGQLGYATVDIIGDEPGEMPPPDVDVGGPAIQVAAGGRTTCALLADGAVRCWGYGLFGVLGLGTMENIGDDEHPADVPAVQLGGPAVQLSVGFMSTCARMASGALRCWGGNSGGALGNEGINTIIGDKPGEMPPVDNKVGGTLVDIPCQGYGVARCYQLAEGGVRCFGGAAYGLGYGNTEDIGDAPGEMPPAEIDLGLPVQQLACGGYHQCALLAGDKVRCWGYGKHGGLGQASMENIGDEPGEMPPPDVQVF